MCETHLYRMGWTRTRPSTSEASCSMRASGIGRLRAQCQTREGQLNGWLDNVVVGRTVYSPSKPTAFTMASATALMLTSSSSPTVKNQGSERLNRERGRNDYPREWQVQRRRILEASIWRVLQGHMRRWIGEVVCLSQRQRTVCRSLVHVIHIIQKKNRAVERTLC